MTQEFTYNDIAGMIDHALLHPTLKDEELVKGCATAAAYETATVCVKPCHVERAVQLLQASKTKVCTVIGFPHGVNLTEVKVLETKRACEQGATEVDMVINPGKALSGDWKFVGDDIRAVCNTAHSYNARLKVIFENDYLHGEGIGLTKTEFIQKLCKISEDNGADWVKTSTGFGYTKQADGSVATVGATLDDVSLMVNACTRGTQVKAAGGVKDLPTLLRMRELGATRIGTSSTGAILDDCRSRLGLPVLSVVEGSGHSSY